jgi:DNA-directed RNA polymerase subunit RPC12/RpoP
VLLEDAVKRDIGHAGPAHIADRERAKLMYEELQQQRRAECPACNGQLRLISALATGLGELGDRTFLCEGCGHRVWVREPPLGRTEVH